MSKKKHIMTVPQDPKFMPENYAIAMAEAGRGVRMSTLVKVYGISPAKLTQWTRVCEAAGEIPKREQKKWHCWECGVDIPYGERFCSDLHKRDYNEAAIRADFVPPVHHRKERERAKA
jgi:hypothetical protein